MSETQGQPLARAPEPGVRPAVSARRGDSLADVLERVLDKGIVVAGDITISLATVELLSVKIRLLIASVDKAREMGINWWQSDPALSAQAKTLERENAALRERLDRLERQLAPPTTAKTEPEAQGRARRDEEAPREELRR